MAPAVDDEDLSLSISTPPDRRNPHGQNGRATHPAPPLAPMTRIPPHLSKPPKQAERLGQYNVQKTLGEGSFGKVKLAIHAVSGQKVALKVISRRKIVTRDMAGRLEREIQYLQLLRHPHIIKLFTVITMPGEIIMVLEYAEGELFNYIVKHGKMAEDKARKFFQQIVCAVEYCHRHKIVHRDLKPENLLLDENLNVKIADFGLSNIMTDGNFLKTSCGSPNYAAPEVISGKLYAGPEVDVWSCGVILYVLLVGRLPFDDEYIPALFAKIAQGNYMVPNYLSSGAKRLIARMLQVNPLHRITIQDIRVDPWFTKDLADYLQSPADDIMDTGVDPNKAIDPRSLAKGKPVVIQEKMHASIVGKLGKTMGYAPDDVQEALAKDEPSAIKDAYLIVRENHLMKTNPSLQHDQPGFVAQSPPAIAASMLTSPRSSNVKMPSPAEATGIEHPRHGSVGSGKIEARSPASTIAVLPSSLPDYHSAYMKGQTNKSVTPFGPDDPSHLDRPRTKEEQEATARRLNPHSRSSTNLHRYSEKPEPLTGLTESKPKKAKQQKWQFGIRSRNTPCEAMLAIFKALRKMGAEWEVPRPKEPDSGSRDGSPVRRHEGSQSPEYSDSDPDPGTDPEYATHEEQEQRRRRREKGNNERGRAHERFGRWNDYGYDLPEDPWVIQARFRKDGMFAPGVAHPSSTHSSRADLHSSAGIDGAKLSALSSTTGSAENVAATGSGVPLPLSTAHPVPGEHNSTAPTTMTTAPKGADSAWIYMTIQLYSIEKDFFLVDFKCAGYEGLAREPRHIREARQPFRRSTGEQLSARPSPSDADLAGANPAVGDHHEASRTEGEPPSKKQANKPHPAHDVSGVSQLSRGLERQKKHDFGVSDEATVPAEEEVYHDENGEELYPKGRSAEEKEISSPFPFLDVASRLIIQLAEAHD